MEKKIVFNPNPFFAKAGWYETPKRVIPDHWVTNEFGFEVFRSGNDADRWIYIQTPGKILKATPEFLEDTEIARLALSK